MGKSTTISLRKTTKGDLIKIKGAFERKDNKIYSFDQILQKIIEDFNGGDAP